MAAMTAAAMLMVRPAAYTASLYSFALVSRLGLLVQVEPAGARPGQRLIDSARKTQQEFEEIFKSRGGFPEVWGSRLQRLFQAG